MNVESYYNETNVNKQLQSDLARKGRFHDLQKVSGKKILDLGCGPGVDISFLSHISEGIE